MCVEDVRVFAWYFGVCSSLERIDFAPLDYDTVKNINEAMITFRYPLFKDIEAPKTIYDVIYTPCCRSVVSLTGKRAFGHSDVAYDIQTRQIICNSKSKETSTSVTRVMNAGIPHSEVVSSSVRVQNKNMRFAFHGVSCKDRPVLQIPLKYHMLVLGGKAKKKYRMTRCPRCAGLHIFDPMRYKNGSYLCEECAKEDLTWTQSGSVVMAYQCSYCKVGGDQGHMLGQTSKPRVRKNDILLIMDVPSSGIYPLLEPEKTFQYLRFCHRCYKIASRFHNVLTKDKIFEKIQQIISTQLKQYQ